MIVIEDSSTNKKSLNEFSIFKSENVSAQKFKEPARQTLGDLVKDQVGVDTQVYCSNCGAKRLTINGLKGEHTSILVDGLPMHSAISSFYGIDNVPINGIESVEVMRGTGASLTNPEAIGGTLNLVTVNPLDVQNQYSTSIGIDDSLTGKSQNHSLLYSLKDENKKWGVVLGGQFARTETWDEDNNNVAEMPQRENHSLMAKSRFLLGKKNDVSIRLGHSYLDILGGAANPTRPSTVSTAGASESDFVDGNVEKKFIGDPFQITDWVELDRTEVAVTHTHYLSSQWTYEGKVGYARQQQSSIYQHGFDYANIDNMFVGDFSLLWFPSETHAFKVGAFFRDQRLRSASETLFTTGGLKKDNFDFSSYAAYMQYTFYSDDWELDFALRADQQDINWRELSNEISDLVLAPRFQALYKSNDHLTQRLSYGLGYRAPLTFFESQHGNQENGYEVDITEMEKAHSVVYSVSYNKPDYYITSGLHYTYLENMAFGFEQQGFPIFYRNSSEAYEIWVADLLLGYKPAHWWLLEVSFETFQYQDGYKRKLPTAAIEERVQLRSSIAKGSWTHVLTATVVGARDLSKYASYPEYNVDRDQSFEIVNGTLNPDLELKNQRSPAYLTLDTSLSYEFYKSLIMTFGVQNLFDYTQASVNDTPSAWHWHFDHAHYDGLHTWGPNQGRQFFLKASGQF